MGALTFLGLPVHPALVHLPVASTLLAAASAFVGLARGRARQTEWMDRTTSLLFVAVVTTPAALLSGRVWSRSLGLWTGSSWLPPADAEEGLLRRHVLAAVVTMALAFWGLLLALAARRGHIAYWPLILIVSATAVAAGFTAHVGGAMVFGAHT
jgi:uncharacterized membrane protein